MKTILFLTIYYGTSAQGVFPSNPACVWNQAYVEIHEEDTYEEILIGARNCYVLIDPFHDDFSYETAEKIASIKDGSNIVGCYFSTGTCEKWRDDYKDIKNFCVKKQWGDWDGEYFVYDIDGILPYMKSRMDLMAEWGCDYTEFDNMDWCTDNDYRDDYGSDPGREFPSIEKCADYNKKLCKHSKNKSMRCMAKSSGYTDDPNEYAGGDLMDAITFESYPSGFNWWSNSHLQGFLDNNKPVVIVHYDAGSNMNKNSCDYVYKKYQDRYKSKKISYICESRKMRKYIHYNFNHQPSPSPTTDSPSSSVTCSDDEVLLRIDLKTDNRAKETSYILNMKIKGKYKKIIVKGDNFDDNTLYDTSICLLARKRYRFTIKDSARDGFAHGDGYFRLSLDGQEIKYDTYKKPKKRIVKKFNTN